MAETGESEQGILAYSSGKPINPDTSMVWLDSFAEIQTLLPTLRRYAGLNVSPDGRWLAYRSEESGRLEMYVRSFQPGEDTALPNWQISSGLERHDVPQLII